MSLRSAALLAATLLLGCGTADGGTADAHVHATADDAHAHVHGEADAHAVDAAAVDDAAAPLDAAAMEDAHVHVAADAQAESDAGIAAGLVVTAELHGAVSRANTHVHIQVTRDGAPLEGAAVTVALWMPAHGHGAPAPVVDDEGGGAYHAVPVFTMAGRWELTIEARSGGQGGRVAMNVDVP